jgi:putative hemolysin
MDSPELGLSVLGLVGVAVLILTNAFFVATEFSLVAVRRSQIDLWVEEGRRGASSAQAAIEHLDDAIAATQLGITLASLGLGWIGEPAVARLIAPVLEMLGVGHWVAVHTVAMVIAFSIITFLHVVIGELAPKALALEHPGAVALACSRPVMIFGRVFRHILAVMNGAGNAIVKLFGVKPASHHESVHSADELSLLVSEARAAGKIRPDAGRLLSNIFHMARTRVRDVMVPREDVLAIEKGMEPARLLDVLRESGFTRLPVYDGTLDDMVGVLHAKDLFHIYAERGVVVLSDAIRPATEIRPELTVTDALRRFRRDRTHLAIVREHGGEVLGVCTLEDVLEEIVGEIEDEHDLPTPAGTQ